MHILLVGLNYKTAPLMIRERCAVSKSCAREIYSSFRDHAPLHSLVILSTCNRTEMIAVSPHRDEGLESLKEIFLKNASGDRRDILPYLYEKTCYDAVSHLFHVASGLDSMVMGETQILGQIKDSYAQAKEAGAVDRVMHQLMQKTFAAAKKVHTATGINDHPTSVSYVAVECAKKICGSLKDKCVLVVGAGKTGQLTARYLKDEGVHSIFVSNRSAEVANALAEELNGEAIGFDRIPEKIGEADVIISCTGACHMVIRGEETIAALKARNKKPLCIIDIAVPRDVDPLCGTVEGVELWDMDRLQAAIASCNEKRAEAANAGVKILEEEIEAFERWTATMHLTPVIAALKAMGEEVRTREYQRAMNRLSEYGLCKQQMRVIAEMGQAIVNQMLRDPVENLQTYAKLGEADDYAQQIQNVFSLEIPAMTE